MRHSPAERSFPASQVRLTYFEWGDRGAPTVLLVHATGFHARCWDRTVAALPEGYRVIALDMRGHGRSEKRGPYQWSTMDGDLEEFVAGLGLEGAIGVGHSMGGHCVTYAAARLPGAFSRLLLVDPVILDPEAYDGARYPGYETAEDHPVARRRNHWVSWQAMFERFRDREPFSLWRADVLEDYCRYGVLPRADGDGFELACPPLVEASIYLGSSGTDVHALIPTIEMPVVVLRAQSRDPAAEPGMDFSRSPTWVRLAEEFPNGRDVYMPEFSHFIPMQDPPLVARFIVEADAAV
ncbi:MAG: alpha/beta hydrolase [Gammaproteobacteria bacterium]|nr:alpha/beta hydrolase [Gammaproteobacteria bacterium]